MRRITELDGIVAQIGAGARQNGVDHQPALMKAEIQQRQARRLTGKGLRPVTPDDKGRLETLSIRQADVAGDWIDQYRRHAGLQRNMMEPIQPTAQRILQPRLVKPIAFMPAHRTNFLRAGPVDQDLVFSVLEQHANANMSVLQDLFRQTGGLKNPHRFAVKMDCARQVIGFGLLFDHPHRQPAPAQQVGQRQSDRPGADDGDIGHNSSVVVPSIRTPSPLRCTPSGSMVERLQKSSIRWPSGSRMYIASFSPHDPSPRGST